MNTITGLKDWIVDINVSDDERFVYLKMSFVYLDIKTLLNDSPQERKKKIQKDRREKLKKLKATNLLDDYEITGTIRNPYGVKAKIKYVLLPKLQELDFINHIFIEKVDHAQKIDHSEVPSQNYYCVRMTVAIQIEGETKGNQIFEDRFVLIKASSFDDAYEKLEKNKDSYSKPYLNQNGQLVRWKIESFDDCCETDITDKADIDNPEGVEVYSKLHGRRLTPERIWDGKT